jgi:hypothetical protein
MTRPDKALTILLRIIGGTALLAVVAVIMPLSWMASFHRWFGLGEMPIAPVVEYLARSLSAFYALFGAFCLFLSSDLARYRPVVRFLGWLAAVTGIALIGIDVAAGMPWWWTASEGPPTIAAGALIVFLARRDNPA